MLAKIASGLNKPNGQTLVEWRPMTFVGCTGCMWVEEEMKPNYNTLNKYAFENDAKGMKPKNKRL